MGKGLLLELELVHEHEAGWRIFVYSVNGVVSRVDARGTTPEETFSKALAQVALDIAAPEVQK